MSQSTICLQQRGISPNFTGTISPIPLPPLSLPPPSLYPSHSIPFSSPLSLFISLHLSQSLSPSLSLPPPPSLSSVPQCLSRQFACSKVEFRQTSQGLSLQSLCFPYLSLPSLYPSLFLSFNPSLSLPHPPSLSSVPQCLSRQFACSKVEFRQTSQGLSLQSLCLPSLSSLSLSPPLSLSLSLPLSQSLPLCSSLPLPLSRPCLSVSVDKNLLAATWNFAKLYRDYPSNPSASPPSPLSLSLFPPLSLPLSSSLSIHPSLSLPLSRPCLSVSVDNLLAATWNFAKHHRDYPSNPSASPTSPSLSLYPSLLLSISPSLSLSKSLPLSPSSSPSLSLVRASVSQSTICLQQLGILPTSQKRSFLSLHSLSPFLSPNLPPSLALSLLLSHFLSQPPSPSLSLVRPSVSQLIFV